MAKATNVIINMGGKRRRVILPAFLGVLLLVALSSFFHSVHNLSRTDNNHAIKESLNDFVSSSYGRKNPSWFENDIQVPRNQSEDPIPNPSPYPGNNSFAACLLVMDDNHRLVEWMAYHYHVLPLRYLVVAIDPRSKTSPTHILNRWRRMGMYIEEWNDFEFFRKDIAEKIIPDHAELQVKRDRHRARQKNFYRRCLIHMGFHNRSYTMLIDTDEFLTYNHAGRDRFEEWERRQLELHQQSKFARHRRIRPSQPPPTTEEPGALIQYIRQEQAAGHEFFQSPCISCPRLQFGATESTLQEREHQVPRDFGGEWTERLDTLRFRKHAYRNDFIKNGLSKSIIDVSRIDVHSIPRIETLHRPIKTICSSPWKDEWTSGLRINHYLGSWEGKSQEVHRIAIRTFNFSPLLSYFLYSLFLPRRFATRWRTIQRRVGIQVKRR